MYSSLFNYITIFIAIILIVIIGCVQITLSNNSLSSSNPSISEDFILSSEFCWPVPRFHTNNLTIWL